MNNRGFFGIGIYHTKTASNVGTLWRSAFNLGASFMFTVGKRYPHQASDTVKANKHIPFYEYLMIDDLLNNIPKGCRLVGIEIHDKAKSLFEFSHPERCCYLLGAEDHGLSDSVIEKCHCLVSIPTRQCMNVAVTGSIVMYDRIFKESR